MIHDPVLFFSHVKDKEVEDRFTDKEIEFLNKRPVYLSIRPTEANANVIDAYYGYLQYLSENNIPVVSYPFHPSQDTDITKNLLGQFFESLAGDSRSCEY